MKPKILLSVLLSCLSALAMIIACSGGGGDGTLTSNSGETGSVALFITDAPTSDYEEIVLTVRKVTLIPPEFEPDRSEEQIFPSGDSSEPIDIRLLNLQDQDLLLNINHNVPAGRYAKIRLYVDDVKVEGGACENKKVKLPSNKLDLNPRGVFEIKPGEMKSIRIDVDAEKSTLLVDNPVMCILRPVAFVEVDSFVERCPRILKGTITTIFEEDGKTGFTMQLGRGRGLLNVLLDRGVEPTVIFDESGQSVSSEALAVEQQVKVRGRLDRNADLLASVVVIGDVLALDGTVAGPVSDLLFQFELDPAQAVTSADGLIDVRLDEQSLILAGCDNRVGTDAIQREARATIVGKLDFDSMVFVAVAVLLREPVLTGELIGIEPLSEPGGGAYRLTVRTPAGSIEEVVLPAGEPVLLQNDGVVPFNLLNELVECRKADPLQVKIVLDPDTVTPTAWEVRVQAEKVFGSVSTVGQDPKDPEYPWILLEPQILVDVLDTATIFEIVENKSGSIELEPGDVESIQSGDQLSAFGLRGCPPATDTDPPEFIAFALIYRHVDNEL